MNDPEELLRIAQEAACRVGVFLKRAKEAARIAYSAHKRDVKIAADLQSEKIIVDFLKKETGLPMLTEESGILNGRNAAGPMWIVDPLDGTLNFSRHIPISCVSIGLWQGDKPLLGTIYDFNRDELFSGINGKGAWLNRKRIRVSRVSKTSSAVLCTGFPVSTDFSTNGVSSFIKQIKSYKKVRLLGSAALSLAYVAAGRADAYYENNIMLWDIAAGLAIVLGAGGRYSISTQRKKNSVRIYVSNGLIA